MTNPSGLVVESGRPLIVPAGCRLGSGQEHRILRNSIHGYKRLNPPAGRITATQHLSGRLSWVDENNLTLEAKTVLSSKGMTRDYAWPGSLP
jgi:hypothetical protein